LAASLAASTVVVTATGFGGADAFPALSVIEDVWGATG
jgi:hypothetical protein